MGNLLSEYRKRHKLDFIWSGCANGTCFFSKDGRPNLICLTSEPTRSLASCPRCPPKRGEITVEFITFSDNKASLIHDHIHPDTDLNAFIRKNLDDKLVPFQARSFKDLEVWLWSLFLQLKPIQGTRWQRFRKSQKGNKSSQVIEQMLWICTNTPSIYRLYYHNFFTTYLLGRNYLMYR